MNYLLKPIEFIMEETKYDNSKSLFKDTKLKVNHMVIFVQLFHKFSPNYIFFITIYSLFLEIVSIKSNHFVNIPNISFSWK